MFWSICSSKGGAGTSVVAAALAKELLDGADSRRVVLIDLCGDQPDILGVDVSSSDGGCAPGVVDWLLSHGDVGPDALEHLLLPVRDGLWLLPRGTSQLPIGLGAVDPERCVGLVGSFGPGTVVVADLGVLNPDPLSARALIGAASDRCIAVVRACYLALRRVADMPVVIDGVVEIVEGGRSLGTLDIESVLGVPVTTRIRHDPAIARAVDAGTMTERLPRALRRGVADVIAELGASAVGQR